MRARLYEKWAVAAAARKYRVGELAGALNINRRTLERQSLEHFHCCPRELITRLRFERAIELLLEGAAIKMVAVEVGYQCAANFCHAFKHFVGVTPRAFVVNNCRKITTLDHCLPPRPRSIFESTRKAAEIRTPAESFAVRL